MLNFDQLIIDPPMKSTTVKLPDGRDVTLHELPLSVIEDVQDIGRNESSNVRSVMENMIRVVSHSLLGRVPEPDELTLVREKFGASTVMFLYYEALKFSRLGPGALDETKKH